MQYVWTVFKGQFIAYYGINRDDFSTVVAPHKKMLLEEAFLCPPVSKGKRILTE